MDNAKLTIEYTLWVKIVEHEGYHCTSVGEILHHEIELPLMAAGACDLNIVAAAMVEECKAKIDAQANEEE